MQGGWAFFQFSQSESIISMPNWCVNELTFSGDRDTIDKMISFVSEDKTFGDEEKFSFNSIIPYPAKYKQMDDEYPSYYRKSEDDATAITEEDFNAKLEAYKTKWNSEKDGFNSGGYDWCCDNWGTKWGACSVYWGENSVSFDTAWSPPIPVIDRLAQMFPTLTFELKFEETGMGYAGDMGWSDGVREYENEYECYQPEEDENGDFEEVEDFEAYRLFHA